MTFDQCCMEVMRAARLSPNNRGLKYAAAYANAGIGMVGEEQRVQALYIRNNLSTWRGEEAKQVKQHFEEFGKK